MATGGKDVSCLARKVEEAFESVIENIAILMKSIKGKITAFVVSRSHVVSNAIDGTLPGVPTKYRKYDYWKTFGGLLAGTSRDLHVIYMCHNVEELTDQISNWCTKLAVMFSKPPSPNMEVRTTLIM